MRLLFHQYILLTAVAMLMIGCARPIANFTTQQTTKAAPSNIEFQNNSKNAESYKWEFGDGNMSESESPSHTYVESGKYTITLYATKGKKTTQTEQVVDVSASSVCLVEMTTEYGKVIIALSDETPLHRDNFLKLVEEGFYEDLIFHRVINGFVIQGGDPTSRNASQETSVGSGGPGYTIPAEFNESLAHVRGALAAAQSPNPEKNSSGSQFYIVHGRSVSESDLNRSEARLDMYYSPELRKEYVENGGLAFLDGLYTVFGKVISGMDVIDKIASVKTDGDPPKGQSRPIKNVKMNFRAVQ